jgi:hypothetical protein
MKRLLGVLVTALVATPTSAQIALDGTRDASYILGPVQTVETQFGDANPNGGSELDVAWAQISGGKLYLMLTGNLENNFNKLDVFIDSVSGGQNQLQADANNGGNNPTNDGWATKFAGFTFDTGFEADYMLILRNGNFGGDRFDIDYAVIGGGASAFEAAGNVFGGSLQGANANALPGAGIGVAFNNSNTAGVTGGTNAANQAAAMAVTTGVELAIPLSALGNPNPQDIKVTAMINGSNHDFLSNQFLPGLPAGQGNLGGDGAGNFNGSLGQISLKNDGYASGDQFFQVRVPEPTAASLLGLACLGLFAVRRK